MIYKTDNRNLQVLIDFHLDEDETIVAVGKTVSPASELNATTAILNRDDVAVTLSGGITGSRYTVSVTASTSATRTIIKAVEVMVLSGPISLPPANTDALDAISQETTARQAGDASLQSSLMSLATTIIRTQTMMAKRFNIDPEA